MDQGAPSELRAIWRQSDIPVIVRKGPGYGLQVKIPGTASRLEKHRLALNWLRNLRPKGRNPIWTPRFNGWELPASWFDDLVRALLKNFDRLYIIQPHRSQEKCSTSCMEAKGHECQCSCLGAHHGSGGPDASWFVVSDAFATRWGTAELAARLMELRDRELALEHSSR